MAVATKSPKSPWDDLRLTVRKACTAKSDGSDSEAIQILKNELPLKMGPWARTVKISGKEKKEVLKNLFQSELERAEDVKEQKAILEEELSQKLSGLFQSQMNQLKKSFEEKLQGIKTVKMDEIDPPNTSKLSQSFKFIAPPKPTVINRENGIHFDDLESILNEALKRCN